MTTTDMRAPATAPPLPDFGTLCARATVVVLLAAATLVLSLSFDARLAVAAQSLPGDAVQWGRFISDLGRSNYMFALAALLAIGPLAARAMLRDHRFDTALQCVAERAAFVFATLAASGLAAQFIKHLVGRARPSLFDSFGPYHFDLLSMKNSLASFPSGHTTTAIAMAVALSLIMPRLRVALFTFAAAIATSRIVVQAHYASDIAAGAMLGALSARLVARQFAERGLAFTARHGRIVLKDPGAVTAAFRALADRDP